ncbi:ribonuclease E/G [Palleronia caenipelagi]|uniref:Ribonuclease G n=1 Tax=Palleronia caenipelagi TaxID=2489174 RepID=A0A547PLH3_9RHOB|nr:ribonuclease E/G [Palleronia caenipelagi]TRD14995.1 ribonuclease G [Palleronia caenipelagi]
MKGTVIHLDSYRGRLAAARMVDGQLDDLLIAADDEVPTPGTIYRAVVDRQFKGQGGVTLRLPDGQSGFLRRASGLRPGQSLLVQVTGYADDGKAVPVTADPLFKSRHVIITPGKPGYNVSRQIRDDDIRESLLELAHDMLGAPTESFGLILRSASETADREEVAGDLIAMSELAATVGQDTSSDPELLVEGPDPHMQAWQDWDMPDALITDPGNFAAQGVEDEIDKLFWPRVALSEDHWMSIEPTRALVAVDVNTGADGSLAAGLKANIACCRALPAALRCRGLGGQIVIDMAPAPKKDRRQIDQVLTKALRADPVSTVIAGWTPLGHVELQRRRERLPLHQLFPEAR